MMTMSKLSRRAFMARTAVTGLVLGTGSHAAIAGGHLPKLDPEDANAKALAYTHASTEEGQKCSNCQLFKGASQWGECTVFPGKEVNADGWCSAWVVKSE